MFLSRIKPVLFLFFLLITSDSFAQPFQKMMNYGIIHHVVPSPSADGFLITGEMETNTNDRVFLLLTDSAGNSVWGKFYRDFVEFYSWGTAIIPVPGGIYLAGMTFNDTISNQEIAFSFTDTAGNMLWSRRMGNLFEDDEVFSVLPLSGFHFLLCGYSKGFTNGSKDIYVITTDSLGFPLWSSVYGGSGDEEGIKIVQDQNGFMIFGTSDNPALADADIIAIRIDSLGNLLYSKRLSGQFGSLSGRQLLSDAIRTADGGFALCGSSTQASSDSLNSFLVKTDAALNVIFAKTFTGCASESYSLKQQGNGGYYIGGSAYTGINKTDGLLLRTDSAGNTLETTLYGDSSIGAFRSIQLLNDSAVICAGSFTPSNQINPHLFLSLHIPGQASCITRNYELQDNDLNCFFLPDSTITGQFVSTSINTAIITSSSVNRVDTAVCELLSFPELSKNAHLKIFPNPAVHEFTISSEQPVNSIRIFDSMGREVLKTEEIPVQFDLPPGIYTLIAESAVQRTFGKLIVQ